MKPTLDFYFDYGSPYSYLANSQIRKLAEEAGAELRYQPILLGGVFKLTGNTPPIQTPVKNKVAYGLQDLNHWAAFYQCEFHFNPHFPVNTLTLMRIACLLKKHDNFVPFHEACFSSIWVEKRNMSELGEIERLLEKNGFKAQEIISKANSEENKNQLKDDTQAAVNLGIFGAPSFVINNPEGSKSLFFGNDRLPIVSHFLKHK